jgi:hypothetical protein
MTNETAIQILKIDAMIEHLSEYSTTFNTEIQELKQLKITLYEHDSSNRLRRNDS